MLGRNKGPVGVTESNQTAATRGPNGTNLPGPAPSTAGPHHQDIANKLDPTVDSMHGGTQILGPGINSHNNHGMTRGEATTSPRHATAHGHEQLHTATGTGSGIAGAGPGTTAPMQGAGTAYNSRLANEIDPRVTTAPEGNAIPVSGASATHGHPAGNAYGETRPAGAGGAYAPVGGSAIPPTRSAPRSGAAPGVSVPEGTYGPHSSRLANAADPRVDSDRDRHTYGTTRGEQTTTVQTGPEILPGPASKTAGPHKSNILNKLDPDVDSKAAVQEQRVYRTS